MGNNLYKCPNKCLNHHVRVQSFGNYNECECLVCGEVWSDKKMEKEKFQFDNEEQFELVLNNSIPSRLIHDYDEKYGKGSFKKDTLQNIKNSGLIRKSELEILVEEAEGIFYSLNLNSTYTKETYVALLKQMHETIQALKKEIERLKNETI